MHRATFQREIVSSDGYSETGVDVSKTSCFPEKSITRNCTAQGYQAAADAEVV